MIVFNIKRIRIVLIISFITIVSIGYSQRDSLLNALNRHKSDTAKVNIYIKLCEISNWRDYDTIYYLSKSAVELAEKCSYQRGLGEALIYKAKSAYYLGNVTEALDNYHRSLKIEQILKDKQNEARVYEGLGEIYLGQEEAEKALEMYRNQFASEEADGNKPGMAKALNNSGYVYESLGKPDIALDYYRKSAELLKQSADKLNVAYTWHNLAMAYNAIGDTSNAFEYLTESLKLMNAIGNKQGEAITYQYLGSLYSSYNKRQKAIAYYQKAIQLLEEVNDKEGLTFLHNMLAGEYENDKNFPKAESHYLRSLQLSREIGVPDDIQRAAGNLYLFYKNRGKTNEALNYFELYNEMSDSIHNRENQRAAIRSGFRIEYERKAASDSVKVAEEKKVVAAQLKQERTQRIALYGGVLALLVFAGFMYNRFRVTNKQKKIIELKEQETAQQKHIIEEKHREISDSINYAERIQRSFMATRQHLDANLKEYFVLFKPKDVVSGDFYWSATLKDGNFILATADSTGHGVPGAIMSLLNISGLEKAIEVHTDPAEILNAAREVIIERLKKDGSAEGGKDGMDCSVCIVDKTNNKLLIAAANNPVWIVRGEEVIEIKPDKMPVGRHDKQHVSFSRQEIAIQEGDVVYTLTDGFPDQFGGEKGKKFMSKNLRELLAKNAQLPMPEQKKILETTLHKWVGNLEQIDDITVIGIRV